MCLSKIVNHAQEQLRASDVDGWLLYDYMGMNSIFWDTLGPIQNVTRPCWLWIPKSGEPQLLVSYVDQGRFQHLSLGIKLWASRSQMISILKGMLAVSKSVAMEYSPSSGLPRVSKVDAGTIELVRSLGVEIVSSADTLQYATQRWTDADLESHKLAATKLDMIVQEAFHLIGRQSNGPVTEYEVANFIRERFVQEGLEVTDGPIVAVNAHAADPHFAPVGSDVFTIKSGDWVLIDLWARMLGEDNMFADITWVAFVGDSVPRRHQLVFDAVVGGRDAAVSALEQAFVEGKMVQGWEIDKVARDYIANCGFGQYFTHRLGHSLGHSVHSDAVNLDSFETRDTRSITSGLAVTVEPGIYIPGEFGVRSEIDVFVSNDGPCITTEVQRQVVLIG
ncbi:MAG: M24 family metallopeptidase [SAR202 cluster bacterium]|nr:M24 family metallopeptidase [SAR202 cluster bacterium]